MSQKSLKEIIEEQFEQDSESLPVFNQVALELQQLKNSPNASMNDISTAIMKDQSLAGKVLQVANSSFYGGLKQVETISQAAVRLGMNQVSSLAMAASQAMAHKAKVPLINQQMQLLWSRAFVSAVGARWLANQTGNAARAEEAFLSALLHNIGELFLLKVLDKLASNKETPLELSQPLIEEIIETLHCEIGYQLMKKWGLPEPYAIVARDHHLDQPDEGNELLLITRLMDIACQKLGVGGQKPASDIVLAASLEAQILGLREIKLAELEIMLEDQIAGAGSLL